MLNRCIFIGRLVADPELRTTEQGHNKTRFRIAVDRDYKDKEGNRKTDFINLVAWRQQAEFVCKYFSKGRLIGIEGELVTDTYTDQDGNKRSVAEVKASRAFFVESKPKDEAAAQPMAEADPDDLIDPNDEDLPF